MKRILLSISVILLPLAVFLMTRKSAAQTLSVTYGTQGVERLSYGGVVLEDLSQNPADTFHIWHMKATDLQGNALTQGQYGWGEVNNGRSWNPSTQSWTYDFVWGSITVAFQQSGNALNMLMTTSNAANSGIIFDGASIYPLVLHFPKLPAGFADAATPQLATNVTGPGVVVADYGSGEVAAVDADAVRPFYDGYLPGSSAGTYTPIMSSTTPDGLAVFLPHTDRPLAPGQTDKTVVSLRFAPSGTTVANLAGDAYKAWAAAWPAQLAWSDRRILGTVYLSTASQGDPSQPAGYPNNPRRYFNDANSSDFDVRTPTGLAAFQTRVLQQAKANVVNLKRLNAQGAITWDIEGEQYPQPTSYVCEPDAIATIAPEMESIVAATESPYHGMKLDDAYFQTMRDAGMRVGVCVRPQHFTAGSSNTAQQVSLTDAQVASELIRKIKFAHDRWGATLFYVDSTVEPDGAVLSADIFKTVASQFPDSLIMPEETTPKHFAYTAPFASFLFHQDLGTSAATYSYYPQAFSVNLVNDVNSATLAQYTPQLTEAVHRGDILMVHADYWQANNPSVVEIYRAAGR